MTFNGILPLTRGIQTFSSHHGSFESSQYVDDSLQFIGDFLVNCDGHSQRTNKIRAIIIMTL